MAKNIRIKHAGTTHTVELLPSDDPYKKIGTLLGLPPTRLTIIRAGKKLPPYGDPGHADAIVENALYLVSGTRDSEQLPSDTRRLAGDAAEVVSTSASELYSRFTFGHFMALLMWLWASFLALCRASVGFVYSMVVPPATSRCPDSGRTPLPSPRRLPARPGSSA